MAAQRRYQESRFWDDWYGQHRDAPLEWSAPVSEAFLLRVRSAISGISLPADAGSRPLRIVELGCGTSGLAPALVKDGHDVIACDFSQEVIDQMRERHPELEWRCCDVLKLAQEFGEGSFDFVVAKTLLDCFLTRSDAANSIRKWFEQVRLVLRDHGRFVLIDKASAPHLVRGVRAEQIVVGQGVDQRRLFLRTLHPKPGGEAKAAKAQQPGGSDRWEVTLQQAADDLATRKAAGGSVLVVEKAEGSAAEAGLKPGDRLLGVVLGDDQEDAVYGDLSMMRRGLTSSRPARFVVERPSDKKTLRNSVSQSQCDYLLRQQRARMLRSSSLGASKGKHELPPIGLASGGRISTFVTPTQGLFA